MITKDGGKMMERREESKGGNTEAKTYCEICISQSSSNKQAIKSNPMPGFNDLTLYHPPHPPSPPLFTPLRRPETSNRIKPITRTRSHRSSYPVTRQQLCTPRHRRNKEWKQRLRLRLYAHVWGDHVTLAPPLIEPAARRDRRVAAGVPNTAWYHNTGVKQNTPWSNETGAARSQRRGLSVGKSLSEGTGDSPRYDHLGKEILGMDRGSNTRECHRSADFRARTDRTRRAFDSGMDDETGREALNGLKIEGDYELAKRIREQTRTF
ncbi:hypothetical protein WN48_07094 [Eufriesea mexicana]|uniref:Uncharacterized protein n=1 Tax=Eufriesea mexicana TaxID=516756 RepID=A0A310SYM7_9HYME|nr:hypothetical protein WN48_07094 [Eufriesea mexicana]